jgi:hypothetical protein
MKYLYMFEIMECPHRFGDMFEIMECPHKFGDYGIAIWVW